MAIKLGYAIHFVADMDRAVAFYRDTLGLTLKFASPGWSEFADRRDDAGAASRVGREPCGHDAPRFACGRHHRRAQGIDRCGRKLHARSDAEHGVTLAEFVDSEGARVSLSGP